MKAIVVKPGKKNSSSLIDLPRPNNFENKILIRTIEVGIDGTDREINNAEYGKSPDGEDYLILGHEGFGEVVELGGEIKQKDSEFQIGDYVVPLVRKPDYCHYCKNGQPDMCIKGNYTEHGIKGEHGFLREYFTADPNYLVRVPKKLKSVGVLLEPLSIVEKGIRQAWKIQERMAWNPKNGIVLGLGPIGILGAFILRLKGINVWIFSKEDENDPKVQIIKKMGVNYLSSSNMQLEEIPSIVKDNIDFILEATGNSIVAINAMSLVGQNGILCLTGVTGGHKKISICADCLNLDLVLGNKLIYGTVNANKIDFEKGIADMLEISNTYPNLLDELISHRFNPEAFAEALKDFDGIKAVIKFS
jgi:threonine dehydrogenase-like Zn-dependent dehydrogenase